MANCPSVICNSCHQRGHMATMCHVNPTPTSAGAARGGPPPPATTMPPIVVPTYERKAIEQRSGKVLVVIDGSYFERCVTVSGTTKSKSNPQYHVTASALRSTLNFIGDLFMMEPVGYWFDTKAEAFAQFLESAVPLAHREDAFLEVAKRKEALINEMSPGGQLENVVPKLVGSMKKQRGYTEDGPGHVWVQSGVDVAIATCLITQYHSTRDCAQVVLLSGDGDLLSAVEYCDTVSHAESEGSLPPLRLCGTKHSISKAYDGRPSAKSSRIYLDVELHKEGERCLSFAPHTIFE